MGTEEKLGYTELMTLKRGTFKPKRRLSALPEEDLKTAGNCKPTPIWTESEAGEWGRAPTTCEEGLRDSLENDKRAC